MREPLLLREASIPSTLVLIRFGRNTLADDNLRRSCEMTLSRWGLYGFSVFELPDGDYDRLARLVPLLLDRQWVLEAAASDLLGGGFSVLPTRDHPHWTVMLAEPTPTQFADVRRHFSEPKRNPVWAGRRRR